MAKLMSIKEKQTDSSQSFLQPKTSYVNLRLAWIIDIKYVVEFLQQSTQLTIEANEACFPFFCW